MHQHISSGLFWYFDIGGIYYNVTISYLSLHLAKHLFLNTLESPDVNVLLLGLSWSAMSKAKFAAARELIAEKRYDEARGLLRTMDHPSVEKWLAKLDEIDPPFPDVGNRSEASPRVNTEILRRLITIICKGYLMLTVSSFGGAIFLTVVVLFVLRGHGEFLWLSAGLAAVGVYSRWKYMNPRSIKIELLKMNPEHEKLRLRIGTSVFTLLTMIMLLRPNSTLLFGPFAGWIILPSAVFLMSIVAWQYWLIGQLEDMRWSSAPTVVKIAKQR